MEIDESKSFFLYQDNNDGTYTFTGHLAGDLADPDPNVPDTITAVVQISFSELMEAFEDIKDNEVSERLFQKTTFIPNEP